MYQISKSEVVCINILIKTIEEAINRNTFNEHELDKIYKTVETLTKRNTNSV